MPLLHIHMLIIRVTVIADAASGTLVCNRTRPASCCQVLLLLLLLPLPPPPPHHHPRDNAAGVLAAHHGPHIRHVVASIHSFHTKL
jgi:hypothetical protein